MRITMTVMIAAAMPAAGLAQVALVRPGQIEAIGPKQDDPRSCPAESIGPKQDDPRSPALAIGPKQDDPRSPALAIGPKQDDPRSPAGSGAIGYNPETDPQASGSGTEMIGPKQDDPRQGIIVQGGRALAIGPKQDDPRSPGMAAVGSYNPETDPQALAAGRCVKKKD